MKTRNKTVSTGKSVDAYINSLPDERVRADCHQLIELMKRITRHEPKMWGTGIVGFDSYHYKYDSGREGDCQSVGFHPSKGKITVYLLDGTVKYAHLLSILGKYTSSRVCLYIKRLTDVDLSILETVIRQSYEYIKSIDGHMHRA